MKRIFGMMPSSEVSIDKRYKDKYNYDIRIQAGPHGYTIIWPDGGTWWKDVDDTDEKNFKTAYDAVVKEIGEIKEIGEPPAKEIVMVMEK